MTLLGLTDEREHPQTDRANAYGCAVPLSDKSSFGTRFGRDCPSCPDAAAGLRRPLPQG
jgi:hypothetical protein